MGATGRRISGARSTERVNFGYLEKQVGDGRRPAASEAGREHGKAKMHRAYGCGQCTKESLPSLIAFTYSKNRGAAHCCETSDEFRKKCDGQSRPMRTRSATVADPRAVLVAYASHFERAEPVEPGEMAEARLDRSALPGQHLAKHNYAITATRKAWLPVLSIMHASPVVEEFFDGQPRSQCQGIHLELVLTKRSPMQLRWPRCSVYLTDPHRPESRSRAD